MLGDNCTATVPLNGKRITAWFGGIRLSVSIVGGEGTVTSQPAGIDCGPKCFAYFEPKKAVTLTATPQAGQVFDGWRTSGEPCAGLAQSATCQVALGQDLEAEAHFSSDPPPVASFTTSSDTAQARTPIDFDGSASTDPDGQIRSYRWDFGDGGSFTDTSPHVDYRYSCAGTYNATLTVTDDTGDITTSSKSITITPDPQHPCPR